MRAVFCPMMKSPKTICPKMKSPKMICLKMNCPNLKCPKMICLKMKCPNANVPISYCPTVVEVTVQNWNPSQIDIFVSSKRVLASFEMSRDQFSKAQTRTQQQTDFCTYRIQLAIKEMSKNLENRSNKYVVLKPSKY